MTSTRIITTLSPYHKENLELLSEQFGCSQAEVIRIALMKLWESEN